MTSYKKTGEIINCCENLWEKDVPGYIELGEERKAELEQNIEVITV